MKLPTGSNMIWLKAVVKGSDGLSENDFHTIYVDQTLPPDSIPPIEEEKSGKFTDLIKDNYKENFMVLPNPFSDLTELTYSLSEESDVKIELVDLTGWSMIAIQFDNQEVGIHRVNLNTERLRKGFYFCNLFVNNRKYTKKVIKQ